MRSEVQELIAVSSGFFVIVAVAWWLYRPRIQKSQKYQAMVVPLANIMDVGFIIMAPAIVLLAGFGAPLAMLAICLVAIAAGFAMSYNIRHYEPLRGTGDPATKIEAGARWALLGASVVNIGYYTLLLTTLMLLPFDLFTENRRVVLGIVILGAIATIGFLGGMKWLNKQGSRTTAFNLAAVIGVVVAFLVFNLQEAISGRWELGENPEVGIDELRQIIGLFAIVQGFEAARYIGIRFSGELRITTMRVAQVIATTVFVIFVATLLLIFLPPQVEAGGTAIFLASAEIGALMPFLLLIAALGSQTAAIIGATSSRSDMLVDNGVSRPVSFLIILIPAILIIIFTDITDAVNIASRVFAFYFSIQSGLAALLAWRNRNWWAVAGFVGIGIIMAMIMIFGLPL
jgi:hypothetical protein